MPQYMRRFNTRKYYLRATFRLKKNATEMADHERSIGELARVVPVSTGYANYAVYSTGKHD